MITIKLPNSAISWLESGDKGISSETIFGAITGLWLSEDRSTPSDPSDFKRCFKLIEQVPEWRNDLWKLSEISEPWREVVENWNKLSLMLIDQEQRKSDGRSQDNGMYDFMKSLGC